MSDLDTVLETMVRRVVTEVVHDASAQIVAQITEAIAHAAGTERRALSLEEAAQRWDVSESTIRRRIRAGELETRKIGTRTVVPIAALDDLFDSDQRVRPAS